MSPPSEVDVIIVGGGAAGCVIAGRLAKASRETTILLIEAGATNRDNFTVRTPALYGKFFDPAEKATVFYVSRESESVGGRRSVIPQAEILGGGSSTNFMVYTRAAASDYDDWETEGWKFGDLLPLFKKIETYHVAEGQDTHGYDGPVHVSRGGSSSALADQFIETAKRVYGVDTVVDAQDFKTVNRSAKWAKWINPVTGKRSDAAHAYVHPVLDTQDNLHLLVESKVVRVLFEGTKAVGVEYVPNKLFAAEGEDLSPKVARARKMVVISAGSLASPQILERSGVGSESLLKSIGLTDIVSDLPGVGENMQDHPMIAAYYQVNAGPDDTYDDLTIGVRETVERAMKEYEHGKGPLATNFIDAAIKWRPSADEVKQMGGEFEKYWNANLDSKPDKAAVLSCAAAIRPQFETPPGNRHMAMGNILTYPASRGSIHVTSLTDVYSLPNFQARHLSHPADASAVVWAYKKTYEIARRMPSYVAEVAGPDLPEPMPGVSRVYSKEDDDLIEKWVRERVDTCFHPSGTCAMKSRDRGGVVDKDLNVYGTTALKVADMSIIPSNVAANTYSTALIIGERAAEIILSELLVN